MKPFKFLGMLLVSIALAHSMSGQIQAGQIRALKTFVPAAKNDSTKLAVLSADNQSVKKAYTVDLLPYKVWEGLITAPTDSTITATVLRNTIGTVTWAAAGPGVYTATKTGAWESGYTTFHVQPTIKSDTAIIVSGVRTSANVLTFNATRAGTLVDTSLVAVPVEIRVYRH